MEVVVGTVEAATPGIGGTTAGTSGAAGGMAGSGFAPGTGTALGFPFGSGLIGAPPCRGLSLYVGVSTTTSPVCRQEVRETRD
jgi:hypothetical protein